MAIAYGFAQAENDYGIAVWMHSAQPGSSNMLAKSLVAWLLSVARSHLYDKLALPFRHGF